ncbi:hypothetical protein GCM10007898_31120 [Dyella flagellata]|uniref:Uncharacterized protein n=1 Tax=Dyella flagellata TaxID=1867833 RepID=A0ABQ5XD13_9GAMM|nr:hypothetical protein GCM10007898_31120 [Dyella flagellata]
MRAGYGARSAIEHYCLHPMGYVGSPNWVCASIIEQAFMLVVGGFTYAGSRMPIPAEKRENVVHM